MTSSLAVMSEIREIMLQFFAVEKLYMEEGDISTVY